MYLNTLLEYHLSVNPKELTDHEWACKIQMLAIIREEEAKQQQ